MTTATIQPGAFVRTPPDGDPLHADRVGKVKRVHQCGNVTVDMGRVMGSRVMVIFHRDRLRPSGGGDWRGWNGHR